MNIFKMGQMKRDDVIKPIIFSLITAGIILLTDYYVDSYASFRITYDKISQIAQEHNYYLGTEIPLSERKAKWARVNRMERKDCMVLGSSRIQMLTSINLAEGSFYNMCVSGGSSVNDYLAEIYILYSQEKLPDRLFMEISPPMFNAHSNEIRWKEWGDNSAYMRQLLKGNIPEEKQPGLGIQWKDIISPAYFQYNFQNLKAGKRVWIGVTDEFDNPLYTTVHKDGSYMYGKDYQCRYSEKEILQETETICRNRTLYGCGGYTEMDESLKETFEELIQFLLDHQVEISFYLPPYSSPMYDFICKDEEYRIITEVERYILAYAQQKKIEILGSYSPDGSGLEMGDFYDPYHIRMEKIMDTLWRR